ncbi:MAG: class I SAM-dependent methyltransferase [Elusimicrobia bacterium]|nr:class I SAM-dependent methyltransferase [Elusimicrobiota bacterium]
MSIHRGDAFGQWLIEAHRREDVGSVIERDDGYVEPEWGKRVYFADHRRWTPAERQALRLARGRVLDVGAGAGRHSLYLQERGLKVTGLDHSPGAVQVCRLRGLKDARLMDLSEIRRLPAASFETVIMMGNNFGVLQSPARARIHLRRLHRVTSAAGRIIAQTMDPFKTTVADHLAYQADNRRRGRAPGQVRLRVRYRKLADPWFDYLFVSEDELKGILQGTGWVLDRTIPGPGAIYIMVLKKAT